jgi:predicted SAM-dependent methyltransferase
LRDNRPISRQDFDGRFATIDTLAAHSACIHIAPMESAELGTMTAEQGLASGQISIPASQRKRVLNAGSGPNAPGRLHPIFSKEEWEQVRLDAEPLTKPDLLGSVVDMHEFIPNSTFDAVWSSHSLEHLYAHEVLPALMEFRRILKDDGFALVTTPDIEAVARLVLEGHIDDQAYVSPAGPITALDMMYGHATAIAQGSRYMAHNTGFTCDRMGRLLLEAGFPQAHIVKQSAFDLWALAMMPNTQREQLIQKLGMLGVNFAAE